MNARMKEFNRQWLQIVLGCLITALGLVVLKHSHVVTGGTAGLSLSLSYVLHVEFHYAFILLNVPFLLFSYWKLGRAFTLRTIIAVVLLSAMTSVDNLLPHYSLPALAGSIVGGALIGLGVSFLFQYGSSLGGSTILVRYFQKKYGWNPGKTNFVADVLAFACCLSALTLNQGLISVLSIAVTSGLMSFYTNRNRNQGPRRSGSGKLSTAAAA
jgi:uncharacterized membrane-anchored protein YitT (DUF2179 family)